LLLLQVFLLKPIVVEIPDLLTVFENELARQDIREEVAGAGGFVRGRV